MIEAGGADRSGDDRDFIDTIFCEDWCRERRGDYMSEYSCRTDEIDDNANMINELKVDGHREWT